MRYYYDTEFIEQGHKHPIDLISLGIVAEDGREYYAQSCEFGIFQASPWVQEHVFPLLLLCPHMHKERVDLLHRLAYQMSDHVFFRGACRDFSKSQALEACPWRTRRQLREDLLAFLDIEQYGIPELWGYYSAYDHVVFCQLFGDMVDLPKGFPMYTRDVKQWCDALGNPRLPSQGKGVHHALEDARWTRQAWEFLQGYEQGQKKSRKRV